MVEEKESPVDPVAATASPPSTDAKVVKDEAKRVKSAKGANQGKKRSDAMLATAADRPSAEELTEAEQLPAVARAEELMDRAGERAGQFLRAGANVGQFLRAGGQQLQQHRALATAADRPSTDEQGDEQTEAEQSPAVVRAEEIMDRAGERVGQLLRAGSHQVQRGIALAREATEDLRAEAESIRRGERSSSN
jgi:hypothetical protein